MPVIKKSRLILFSSGHFSSYSTAVSFTSFFETLATDLGWEVYAVVDSGLDLKFRGTSEVGAKTSTGLDRAAGARHTLFNFLRTGDQTHDFVPAGTGKFSTTQLHLWLPSFFFF